MAKSEIRKIVLDVETTGLDPKNGHRVIEIGAIKLDANDRKTKSIFHQYINPERDVPADSYRIHGISSEFLLDKPKFVDIADSFLEFIGEHALVIHNAAFDVKFLNFELARIGRRTINIAGVIDTLKLANAAFPGKRASLDALCERFGIDNSNRGFHGALIDSELLADVYLSLTDQRVQFMLGFEEVERDEMYTKHLSRSPKARNRRRPVAPSLAELNYHQRMAKTNLNNSMWDKFYS